MTTQKAEYSHIPLEKLVTPPSNREFHRLIFQHWWCIDPEKGAIIYLGQHGQLYSPQCNKIKSLVEGIASLYPGCEIKFIKRAWLSHDCHDYVS